MWDIYDQYGNWLGTESGFGEDEAIANAKLHGMAEATKAEPCKE